MDLFVLSSLFIRLPIKLLGLDESIFFEKTLYLVTVNSGLPLVINARNKCTDFGVCLYLQELISNSSKIMINPFDINIV